MQIGSYRQRNLACTEHVFDVPLDHSQPDGERIEVYAREVVDATKADADLPRLLFLQGGPGGKGPRPVDGGGWLGRVLKDYRLVLLDQRGTGRSTPATRQTLSRFAGPEEQAAYLAHFRADAIVHDSEVVRRGLVGDEPWSALGQSYGGFCATTYLSLAPEGLREVFITGGLPPLSGSADDVYRLTYPRTRERNEAYFERHPDDRDLALEILRYITDDVRLPTGERLSPRMFQAVGMRFGMRGGFDAFHYLLEEAFVTGRDGREPSDTFLAGVAASVSFAGGPMYAVLHEPCYCQGSASRWSAERLYAERPEFSVDRMLAGETPFLFTGEMVYPFMFDEDPSLAPLRDAANLLADKDDWPDLYDAGRLAANSVRCYAAVYYEDMYVAREHSLATATAVRRLTPWITNEYEHDGLRESTAVLDRLFSMAAEAR